MALVDTIKRGVESAFRAIGDIKETVTYKRFASDTYDTESGEVSSGGGSVDIDVVLLSPGTGFSALVSQMKNPIGEVPNRFALFPTSALSFTPKAKDEVHLSSGHKYVVLDPDTDPARAHWKLPLKLLP